MTTPQSPLAHVRAELYQTFGLRRDALHDLLDAVPTGGLGSVGTTLVGVILLGLIFNMLNCENGQGVISLSSYWQTVIRGAILLIVVLLQNRLSRRRIHGVA